MISEFEKEKVFWTRKMNLKLVKFIESRPNIWNPKHPKYTSVKYRDKTYADFAAKYGNEFTGQAVKDRWTNIRSTFANYLRKLKASQEGYKITWHLWDACKFLLKVNKNVQVDTTDNSEDLKDDIREDEENVFSDESSESSGKIDETCKKLAKGILNIFRGVQNDAFGIDNTKHGQIGKLVTSKLSQMSSYDAEQMSSKIMEILLLYHEDNPLNPNNVKPERI